MSELDGPVPEGLQRQPVRLAIFSLINSLRRQPSRCARQRAPSSALFAALNLSIAILPSGTKKRSKPFMRETRTSVSSSYAYSNSLFLLIISLLARHKFPVLRCREFDANQRNSRMIFGSFCRFSSRFFENSLFFGDYQGILTLIGERTSRSTAISVAPCCATHADPG